MIRGLTAVLFWCLASLGPAAAAAAGLQVTPLVGEVLWAPHPVPGSDGRTHLVYELRIANVTPGTATLQQVDVVDAATGATLTALDHDAIAGRLSIGGRRGAESADLMPGQFGVLFVHVTLAAGASPPKAIAHRVAARFTVPQIDFTTALGETDIPDGSPVVIGPPLAGLHYVAGDGCCDSIRHVRALLSLNGRFALAQRFAIDWEAADAGGHLLSGDPAVLTDYYIYGRDVLAVADGVVVAARNTLDEQKPGKLPDGLPIDEADGNFIVLDIGGGHFVLFAHMQKGTVNLEPGVRVKRGDILGKVGNTGNSQAPHLHLHVMDGPDPLSANGLPYVIDGYHLTAVDRAGTADFDRAEATGSPLTLTPVTPPQDERNTLPLDLSVVDFTP